MKLYLSGLLALAAALSQAQADLKVMVNGQDVGRVRITQKITEKGFKAVQLMMKIKSGKKAISLQSDATYNAKGVAVRKHQEMYVEGERFHRQLVVSFDSDGATAVQDVAGSRKIKKVPLVENAPREDATEFWFLRDKPAVGDIVKVYTFNLDTLEWELVTTTYKGVRPLTVGDHKVVAHVTESEKGTYYLDDEGLPYRLELTNAVMERVWKS